MAGHAAARRDDCLRRHHAVKIVGAGFLSHQNDLCAFLRHFFRFVRAEYDLAVRCARARRQTGREHARIGLGIDGRMQQLIQLFGSNALDCRSAIDQFLARHVHGDANRSRAGPLARARLQHPKLATLDGELAVLHVLVMFL